MVNPERRAPILSGLGLVGALQRLGLLASDLVLYSLDR